MRQKRNRPAEGAGRGGALFGNKPIE